ncbi:peptidylprolyl isomerase [Marinicella sp. W31]|uniref:peptidylprolyl isomerase n=1 Tax=Marinicella sp. W31 TaxID=3023713 RepID=UPI003757ADFE
MKILSFILLCQLGNPLLACQDFQKQAHPDNLFPEVVITTSLGDITVELDRRRAPLTVNAFLHYIDSKSYEKSLVHRVVPDYVVQGGAFTEKMASITSCGKLFNESGNGLSNKQNTIAMARHNEPHSAETSFYFNLQDNTNLDPNEKSWGYTVFGYVIGGQDILQQISQVKTGTNSELNAKDVPLEPILIQSVVLQ